MEKALHTVLEKELGQHGLKKPDRAHAMTAIKNSKDRDDDEDDL